VPGRDPIHIGADSGPVACLFKALGDAVEPPYRAVGIRHEGSTWAVGERALEIDGRPTAESIPALEEVVGGRFDAYVARATRLDTGLWEIGIDPL